MKPWILGLTGGIGSGKSVVVEEFGRLGVHWVDADHAARWVVEPGRPALASIVERFGETVSIELKPGGDNIEVTNENKHEYVEYVDPVLVCPNYAN